MMMMLKMLISELLSIYMVYNIYKKKKEILIYIENILKLIKFVVDSFICVTN